MAQKVTLRRIAEELGIAHSSVQRALSGHPNVSPELREKVAKTAGAMGYILPSHHTRNIAVIIHNPNICEYLQSLLNHLLPVLSREGYTPCVIPETDVERINEFLFDGIISTTWSMKFEKFYPRDHVLPIVSLNTGGNPAENIYQTGSDEKAGVLLVMEYLYEAGHRRIGFAVIRDAEHGEMHQRERLETYQEYCRDKGLPWKNSVFCCDDPASIARAAKEKRIDALVWGMEGQMIKLYAELAKHKIRIPKDLSIVGWESESLSPWLQPPLTTISQNFDLLAEESVAMLKKKINGEAVVSDVLIPYRLIERKSVRKRTKKLQA